MTMHVITELDQLLGRLKHTADPIEAEDLAYAELLRITDTLRKSVVARQSNVPAATITPALADEIKAMSLINAIKHVRARTGWGLYEAKKLVEAHRSAIS